VSPRKFFVIVVSGYLAFVMLGAVVAFLWIDDSEFMDPFSISDWCESVIKGQIDGSTVSYVWNCYDSTHFWTWAIALGTFFGAIGIAIWAATAFLMRLLRLEK
jgi:hypothetical protein